MRKLLLLLTVWGITNTLSAQEKTFAPFVKGGVLISNGTTNDSQEALWGYNLGVGAYIHLFKNSSLYAVPSLELKRKGARLSAQYDAEITTKKLSHFFRFRALCGLRHERKNLRVAGRVPV